MSLEKSDLSAQTSIVETTFDRVGIVVVTIGDRDDRHLDWCQPHREGTGVMLHEYPREALDRTCLGAVNHVRLLGGVPRAHVFELEPIWQAEVELDRRALPASADGVLDVNIDLGAVEGSLTGRRLVGNPVILEGLGECFLGDNPSVGISYGFLRLGAQVGFEIVEPEIPQPGEDEVEMELELVLDLVFGAEGVRVGPA